MSILGMLLIAFFFSSSTARTYFSMNRRLLCPNRVLTTLILAPSFSNCVLVSFTTQKRNGDRCVFITKNWRIAKFVSFLAFDR